MPKVVIDIPTTEAAEKIRALLEQNAPELGLKIEYSKILLRLTEATHDTKEGTT